MLHVRQRCSNSGRHLIPAALLLTRGLHDTVLVLVCASVPVPLPPLVITCAAALLHSLS
jgi:hypothetical protein